MNSLINFLMIIFFKKRDIASHIHRKFFAEWIKPIYPTVRHSLYGLHEQDLLLSKSEEDADVLILPLTWNYYLEYGKLSDAMNTIQEYEKYKKPILSWTSGDYSLKIPEGNYVLLQHNLSKSKLKKNQYAYPAIIRDPIANLKLYGIDVLSPLNNFSISFCGVANRHFIDKYKNQLKEFFFKIKSKMKKPYLSLDAPISGMKLRGDILHSFVRNTELKTNIIIRNPKDGFKIENQIYKTEYWDNMLSAPFTLCIRGNGNFSVRLYEALALGRIPVIIDTDCVFPLENQIDWQRHCIFIFDKDPKNSVRIARQLLGRMSNDHIRKLQLINRKLWLESLSFAGFYYNFSEYVLNNLIPEFS